MQRRLLKPFDVSWLLLESEDTPMHVAGLFIFELPRDAPPRYLQDIVKRFRAARTVQSPWNQKLQWVGKVLPSWVEDEALDLDYHFRHSALPAPGGERELGVLVSRLHSHPLDLTRPLWEMHLIEGLEKGRFALYFKMHHSLIDGVSAIRMLLRWASLDPEVRGMPPVWAMPSAPEAEKPAPRKEGKVGKELAGMLTAMGQGLLRTVRAAADDKNPLVAPFTSPRSMLSGPMNGQRRLATAQLELSRLRELAKAGSCTLNDVVLYLCGTVLRRFLHGAKALPKAPLTAACPVNLREAGDQSIGATQIGMIYVSLGTHVADPRKRLDAIVTSSAEAKRHLLQMPSKARMPFTLLTGAPTVLTQLIGIDGYIPPICSVVISNVPGPNRPLYLDGARLLAVYPVSLLTRGSALNITCVSCDGKLNFGFTGARDTLPHLQRMAVALGAAADELEAVLAGAAPNAAPKKAHKKTKPTAKKPAAAAKKAAPAKSKSTPQRAARRRAAGAP